MTVLQSSRLLVNHCLKPLHIVPSLYFSTHPPTPVTLIQAKDFKIGLTVSTTCTYTKKDIDDFARLTGDTNPIHTSAQFAATTQFKRCIVHGTLLLGTVSGLLGTRFGPNMVYLGQTVRFPHPGFVDEPITATVTLLRRDGHRPVGYFKTECTNHKGEVCMTGEAEVFLPRAFRRTAI